MVNAASIPGGPLIQNQNLDAPFIHDGRQNDRASRRDHPAPWRGFTYFRVLPAAVMPQHNRVSQFMRDYAGPDEGLIAGASSAVCLLKAILIHSSDCVPPIIIAHGRVKAGRTKISTTLEVAVVEKDLADKGSAIGYVGDPVPIGVEVSPTAVLRGPDVDVMPESRSVVCDEHGMGTTGLVRIVPAVEAVG